MVAPPPSFDQRDHPGFPSADDDVPTHARIDAAIVATRIVLKEQINIGPVPSMRVSLDCIRLNWRTDRRACLASPFPGHRQGVVHDPFGGVQLVVILVAEMSETLGNSLKSRSFRLSIQRVVRVGTVHDPAEQN